MGSRSGVANRSLARTCASAGVGRDDNSVPSLPRRTPPHRLHSRTVISSFPKISAYHPAILSEARDQFRCRGWTWRNHHASLPIFSPEQSTRFGNDFVGWLPRFSAVLRDGISPPLRHRRLAAICKRYAWRRRRLPWVAKLSRSANHLLRIALSPCFSSGICSRFQTLRANFFTCPR